MPSSFRTLLAILAVLSHYSLVQAWPFPAPFLEERQASTVPSFVTAYAPIVWLYSGETYFPSDIGAQLVNTKPEINFTVIDGYPTPLTLNILDTLNAKDGSKVYLTSVDDITTNPAWLNGLKPDSTGKSGSAVSLAVIVNDRGNGEVDAFYMYFYAYNWGGTFLDEDVDDHVGDWEHNMVRFQNGVPSQVWYSQHSFGEAFTYDCLEKQGLRPVTYSANGSHANYATNGTHDHSIPNLNLPGVGVLTDYTDQGTLWDPLLGANFYSYNADANTYTAYDSSYPTAWLQFIGQWGDEQYSNSDPRQHEVIPGILPRLTTPAAQLDLRTSSLTGPKYAQLQRAMFAM